MKKFIDKAEIISNYIELFDDNLSIISVGYNDFNYVLPFKKNRVQNFFSAHFVLSGKGILEIYGKRHIVKQYDMFLIPANETVCYYPDPEEPWEYFWIDYVGNKASFLSERMGFHKDTPYFACNSPYSVYSIAKKFFDQYEASGEVGYFRALSLFYSIIDINSNFKKIKAQSLHDQVIFYIDTHYHDANLKISDICDFFNISHSRLCDLFKGGETVKGILTSKRIEEAKRLLFEGELFVGEVGRSVGFMNAEQFMKVFKKSTGMSAGEYRKFSRKIEKEK